MIMKRFIFGAFIMLSIYAGTNFYIARSLYLGIITVLPNLNVWLYAGLYAFIALSLFVRFFPVSYSVKRFMNCIGVHWIGIFVYFLLFFITADLVILLSKVARIIPNPMPSDIRLWSTCIVVVITAALMLYGKYNAAKIRHVSYDIQLRKTALPKEIRIVMIADLHFGYSSAEKDLPKIVQGINDLKPDIVCIAGDIFNDDINLIRDQDKVIGLLKSIKTVYGVYACLGNHDAGRTFPEMKSFLERSDITLLNDEYRIIDDRFILIGRVESSPIGGLDGLKRINVADIMVDIESDLPVFVMDHSPAYIDEYDNRFDLILSGHTHRGQFFPFNIVTKSIFAVDYGYYQKNSEGPHVIVTSGASTWGTPIRIGTNNEIVSIIVR